MSKNSVPNPLTIEPPAVPAASMLHSPVDVRSTSLGDEGGDNTR
jgi:hypothetical protein